MGKVRPGSFEAGSAADMLGVPVFYLGSALRDMAAQQFRIEADQVRGFERPNFGLARRLLHAAEACEKAWDQEEAASAEDGPEAEEDVVGFLCRCSTCGREERTVENPLKDGWPTCHGTMTLVETERFKDSIEESMAEIVGVVRERFFPGT
jgi:hypothetical protein